MGHHWPGADWPENNDTRAPRIGGGPPRAAGPPPWHRRVLGFADRHAGTARPQRGPKVRRGDVRTAIIDVLHRARTAEEPINGYQVIQEISELSNGEWRPSPGSVYPTIQQLQDEGLVEADDERGRRTIRLTDERRRLGRGQHRRARLGLGPLRPRRRSPTEQPTGQGADIKSEIGQVVSAVWQLATQGSEQQRQRRARRARRHPPPPLRHPRGRTGRRAMSAPRPATAHRRQ